ncbi:sensor histidine kinase [Pedobacter fastidiosus]|uniref:Histidine kinase n=1 Tax=Pedobacter fastidiosus TaxID=2765361 RepID=A0ABR7KX24_9SPHI|nr:histidine kinase [Pedobacter fastidiosus]MBC6112662.1 histidine kinase [Pedobacter fastidiosus]
MYNRLFLLCFLVATVQVCKAQQPIVLNGQPNWKADVDIADKCLFFEDLSDKPLSFEAIQKQKFIPFSKNLQKQRLSNRPLITQWLKVIVSNISTKDTINLHLDASAHYYTKLYANNKLIARGGAYETNAPNDALFAMPFTVLPKTTVTLWVFTQDRQNQLVDSHLFLKTPNNDAVGNVKNNFEVRYLFLLMAAIAGCLFFISVYAIYQYYLYRDTAFKWYIGYTIASFFITLYWMDIRLHIMIFNPFVRDIIFSIFLFFVPVLYTFFIGSMLQLPHHFKKGWLLVKVLVVIAILQMLIEFVQVTTGWFMFPANYYGVVLSVIPIIVLNVILLILTAKSKDAVKWFLFSGLVSMLLLWCVGLTGFFAFIPWHSPEWFVIVIFPPVFMMLGIAIEAICFSFALSYRSKLVLVEKNNLQKNYNQQLETALQKRTTELETQAKLIEAQKIKQLQTTFEHQIAETQMTALRAQMNPHFIFNCLNSIKLYTLENNADLASEYLTMFSQLIRLVLENSHADKVTLQKELETLKLYIELEAMRFKDKVRYEINIQSDLDQQYIEIPPLLLQPYVENAIWHGLMHKKEGGIIKIDVVQLSEHLLQVEITDNGIGRELANSIKSKSATKQKSFGLEITSERIHLINQLYQINTDVNLIDLKDEKQNPIGTKVIIKIPI